MFAQILEGAHLQTTWAWLLLLSKEFTDAIQPTKMLVCLRTSLLGLHSVKKFIPLRLVFRFLSGGFRSLPTQECFD